MVFLTLTWLKKFISKLMILGQSCLLIFLCRRKSLISMVKAFIPTFAQSSIRINYLNADGLIVSIRVFSVFANMEHVTDHICLFSGILRKISPNAPVIHLHSTLMKILLLSVYLFSMLATWRTLAFWNFFLTLSLSIWTFFPVFRLSHLFSLFYFQYSNHSCQSRIAPCSAKVACGYSA